MSKQRKNIFEWNHISDKLNQAQIQELKEYYHNYTIRNVGAYNAS